MSIEPAKLRLNTYNSDYSIDNIFNVIDASLSDYSNISTDAIKNDVIHDGYVLKSKLEYLNNNKLNQIIPIFNNTTNTDLYEKYDDLNKENVLKKEQNKSSLSKFLQKYLYLIIKIIFIIILFSLLFLNFNIDFNLTNIFNNLKEKFNKMKDNSTQKINNTVEKIKEGTNTTNNTKPQEKDINILNSNNKI